MEQVQFHRNAEFLEVGMIEYVDLETMYVDHGKRISTWMRFVNKNEFCLRCDVWSWTKCYAQIVTRYYFALRLQPGFEGCKHQNLAHKNLIPFSTLISESGDIDCGLATDGDADSNT